MTTIAYDRPVLDLIAGLDATGHVTHTQHRKDMVTLHHNGGRLSHQGVLSVWQTRPASAHFNVDAPGTVAQYVRVNEYAWSTGSTEGNQRSISIEMCNQSLSPDWVVGEATWQAAGRLAGWLFLRVIGARPTSRNLVVHKYWFATACAGPHIDKVYNQILAIAQRYYDTGGDDNEMELTDRMENAWGTFPTVRDVFATMDYRIWAIENVVNAMSTVVAQIAENDENITLDPSQLQVLRSDISGLGDELKARLDAKFDEAFANLELDADLGDDDVARIKDSVKNMLYTQMFVGAAVGTTPGLVMTPKPQIST